MKKQMRKAIIFLALALLLAACASPATATATPLPTSTSTPIPTATVTKTPIPTATPQRELTFADVGLPIDTMQLTTFRYKKCYIFTMTHFHAGDIINFKAISPNSYTIIAPIDGQVISDDFISPKLGWEINVRTNFLYQGQTVYYDIVHTNGFVDDVAIGTKVRKGEPLAIIKQPYNLDDGGFALVDFALRNSSHKQANPNYGDWIGTEYMPFSTWVLDDLKNLPEGTHYIDTSSECHGSLIPEAKRTPHP